MAKQKFYVVWEGRKKGIFTDWDTTHKLVSGFPKSKFKSYPTRQEAEVAYSEGPATNLSKRKPSAKKGPSKSNFVFDKNYQIHIFCDGGCDPNPGPSGSGVVVYEEEQMLARYFGLFQLKGTNNTAELNALHQSMILANKYLSKGLKVQILADSTYAIKAMTVWGADWQKRGWKRKTGELINADLIQKMYDVYLEIKGQVDFQHVKAHAGTEGNELADRLSLLSMQTKEVAFKLYEGEMSKAEMLKMGNS